MSAIRLQDGEVRKFTFSLRLSNIERKVLNAQAAACGLGARDFIREFIRAGAVKPERMSKEDAVKLIMTQARIGNLIHGIFKAIWQKKDGTVTRDDILKMTVELEDIRNQMVMLRHEQLRKRG